MTRWAHVRDGVVVAVSEGQTPPTDDASTLVACDATVQETDTYDGSAFAAGPRPLPPVPPSVTMRQARLALLGAGLLSSVESAIDAMSEPASSAARIEWDYSNEVQRHNGVVAALGPALGLSDAQIDALFRTAARL